MEVVEGTEADRKGGHIARRRADGQLVLRETAQTPPEDEESFRDYRRWRYYNTNNLWVDLRGARRDARAARRRARAAADRQPQDRRSARLRLDPRWSSSRARWARRSGASPARRLLCVPRTRFVPVKTTDDLLVLRSDVYALTERLARRAGARARRERCRSSSSTSATTGCSTQFEARFPAGPPSLREARAPGRPRRRHVRRRGRRARVGEADRRRAAQAGGWALLTG